ncbi:MAG TPA: hypothetical protein DCQ99_09845 [Nitrospinae bacterium]|nr:hypothetical protein [Nitrospinota bacterium]HBA26549.1 hypothetical protein [Nitrospinota bacterium]
MKYLSRESNFLYIGIYLTSLSTLLFEISLTRIFSIAQWYHFAFMVVSMALLGYGISGTFLMLFPSILKRDTYTLLSNSALLFAISSPLAYIISNQIAFDPIKIAWDSMQIIYILFYYILFSIPFFFSGMTISIAISKFSEKVHRIYFSDLLGAGSGCIISLFIFFLFGASNAVAVASISGILASAFFYLKKKGVPYRFFLIAIPLSIIIFSPTFMEIAISPYKGLSSALRYPDAKTIKTKWDSISRVDVIKSGAVRFAPGLSLKFQGELPEQLGLTVDGGSLNAVTRFTGNKDEIAFTDYLPSAMPYYLIKPDNILIFDPRGGLDMLSAIYHGATNIESVEFYPLLTEIVKNDYREFSGGIYDKEKIGIKSGDGRTFIRQSKNRYDIIQISPGDAFASSSTGIYGLTEDYRFTVEAFRDYIEHLNENGILTITLYLLPPPRHELKVVSTAIKTLEEMGIISPEKHISVVRTWGTITIIIKKGELNSDDINKIKDFCKERHFDIEYYPGIKKEETNIYNRFQEPLYFNLLTKIFNPDERKNFFNNYIFDVTPVIDDRPFFHHFFKWNTIAETYNTFGRKWQPFFEGGYLIPVVFIQALVVSIVFIILPLLFLRKINLEIFKMKDISFLLYFLLIGIGFMFAEISMIQQFILFLGHPVYSITTVLFTILISSGTGSYLSGRYFRDKGYEIIIRKFKFFLIILCGLIIIYSILLPYLFNRILFESIIYRQTLSFILLFPLGFFMGIPFPTGIKLLERYNTKIIPWAWCINGCSSVVSSILVIIIALTFGFKTALILSAVAYSGGFLMLSKEYEERL